MHIGPCTVDISITMVKLNIPQTSTANTTQGVESIFAQFNLSLKCPVYSLYVLKLVSQHKNIQIIKIITLEILIKKI